MFLKALRRFYGFSRVLELYSIIYSIRYTITYSYTHLTLQITNVKLIYRIINYNDKRLVINYINYSYNNTIKHKNKLYNLSLYKLPDDPIR